MTKLPLSSTRGSVTIEATLIVAALLTVLAVLIFSFLLMYNQVLLSRTASLAAQEAAWLWLEDNGLYYRLFEDNMASGDQEIVFHSSEAGDMESSDFPGSSFYQQKFARIKQVVDKGLQKTMGRPAATIVRINYDNSILTRRIQVTITQEMPISLGRLKGFFSGKDTIALTGTGSAAINDPVGFVRNVDLALEYGSKVQDAVDWKALKKTLEERIRKWGGKM